MKLRTPFVVAGFTLALGGPAASQGPSLEPNFRRVCVEPGGQLRAPVCRAPASRLDPREDVCLCARGALTDATICPPGVAAPPESAAVEQARAAYLRTHPDLRGAVWEGRPLCVAGRAP